MPSQWVGTVAEIWRYPVKSMQGEQLSEAVIDERGLLGDRAYAIIDKATGHVASAKHPRKWAALFACRAAFSMPPQAGLPLPPVDITLPNGETVRSSRPDIDQILSAVLGREVTLTTVAPGQPTREANRAPVEQLVSHEVIELGPLAVAAPAGTFFDYAPVHLLTTATLAAFETWYPQGRFAVQRFRPNILVVPPAGTTGFVENQWVAQTLLVGDASLAVIDPCPRCVITTLAQGDLPSDPGILRTVSQHNAAPSATFAPGSVFSAVAGVYAQAVQGGVIRHGDSVLQQATVT